MDCMQYTLCNMACAQYGLSAIITTLIAQSHNSGTSSISPQSLKQTPIGHYRSHMHAHVHVLTTLRQLLFSGLLDCYTLYICLVSVCTVMEPAVHLRIEQLLPMSHHDNVCCSSLQGGAPVQWWCHKFREWQQSG